MSIVNRNILQGIAGVITLSYRQLKGTVVRAVNWAMCMAGAAAVFSPSAAIARLQIVSITENKV